LSSGFGQAIRREFLLDPSVTYLNHGAFGAIPRVVSEAQLAFRREVEANPTLFYGRIEDRLEGVLEQIGPFVGADPGQCVFVDNATYGVNSVLSGLDLRAGDELICTTHVYPGVRGALAATIQRVPGVRVVEVPVYPNDPAAALSEAITPRTRLAVLDHITSGTALVLPLAQMIEACHDADVPVLVDGAHVPGQLQVDVTALGAEYYTGNLHKWAFAPRPCAFLHSTQPLRPLVGSINRSVDWRRDFHWPGTHDASAWLASVYGLAFLRQLGLTDVRAHNNTLCRQAGRLVAEALGTELPTRESMHAAMTVVELPSRLGTTADDMLALRERLRADHQIEVAGFGHEGRLFLRLSTQVYNEVEDYERLAEVLR